jgi:hypothetical protein
MFGEFILAEGNVDGRLAGAIRIADSANTLAVTSVRAFACRELNSC